MTGCNATLTTATVTDDVVGTLCDAYDSDTGHFHAGLVDDGATVRRKGDRLARVEVHTYECLLSHAHLVHGGVGGIEWTDKHDGATPHDDPLVTDAELETAKFAYSHCDPTPHSWAEEKRLRAALEAVTRLRQKHDQ